MLFISNILHLEAFEEDSPAVEEASRAALEAVEGNLVEPEEHQVA